MSNKLDLIDRRDVIAMFPNMTLRKFKCTRVYAILKIHSVELNRRNVFYPRSEVVKALKISGFAS